MKRLIPFLIISLFLVLNSCGPKGPTENQKLRAEVIAVHDEVMPKMGQLKSLERKALDKVKELESEDPLDSAKIIEYKALAYDLNQAHESMFDWMRQYEPTEGEETEEEIKEYLDNQMVLVTEVNVEIKETLDKASRMLD